MIKSKLVVGKGQRVGVGVDLQTATWELRKVMETLHIMIVMLVTWLYICQNLSNYSKG